MSLLSRSRLNIVLCPSHIALMCTGRKLTLQGMKHSLMGKESFHSRNDGEMPWSGALDALGTALPRFVQRDMQASVILSNHFVHYVLVPWCDGLSEEDEVTYARHCFRELYSDAADAWEVRVSPNSSGLPTLASAVDSRLLEELRKLLGRVKLNLKSIQPHLMVAFNSCRLNLDGRNAWLALLEPGSLCLAVLKDGKYSWIRKMKIGDAWRDELPTLLDREAYLSGAGADINEVLLWAPQHEDQDLPVLAGWNIRHLKPSFRSGHALLYDGLPNGERE